MHNLLFRTLRSRSSENVSTMIPKIMFKPMVVMNMKKDTWYKTSGQNVSNESFTPFCLIFWKKKKRNVCKLCNINDFFWHQSMNQSVYLICFLYSHRTCPQWDRIWWRWPCIAITWNNTGTRQGRSKHGVTKNQPVHKCISQWVPE